MNRRYGVVAAMFLVSLGVAPTLKAQAGWVNNEEFRKEYTKLLDGLVAGFASDNTARGLSIRLKLLDARKELQSLPFEALDKMAQAHDRAVLASVIATFSRVAKSNQKNAVVDLVGDPLPDPFTSWTDSDGTLCSSEEVAASAKELQDRFIALTALTAVRIPLDYACGTNIIILGNGTNAPLCIAAGIAAYAEHAAQAVYEAKTFCSGLADGHLGKATFQNVSAVHKNLSEYKDDTQAKLIDLQTKSGNVQSAITTSATATQGLVNTLQVSVIAVQGQVNNLQSSVNAVQGSVNTANSNVLGVQASVNALQTTATQIKTNVDALQAQDLRLTIETNLLSGPAAPVGIFQLPASQGGYIEVVRAIVVETISKFKAVNASVNNADTLRAQGDNALAAKDYKLAYKTYQSAYAAAVK